MASLGPNNEAQEKTKGSSSKARLQITEIKSRETEQVREYSMINRGPGLLDALRFCHIVGRVPGFFSSRPNWESSTPSPTGECVPLPPLVQGGLHTRWGKREGGSQFRRGDSRFIFTLWIWLPPPPSASTLFISLPVCHRLSLLKRVVGEVGKEAKSYDGQKARSSIIH